jgi:hypothetical protein
MKLYTEYGVKIDVRCLEHEWNLHLPAYQESLLVIWLGSSSSGRIRTAKQHRFNVSPPELAVGETAMLPVGIARTQSVLNILAQKLDSA